MSNTSITDSSTALHHQEFSFLDQQKLLNIIQAMMDAVLVFTPEGIIRFYNPAFEKTFGFTRESRAGKTLDEIFQAVAPGLPQVLKQSIASPEPSSLEIRLDDHHQERSFLLNTTPIAEGGTITEWVAIFHDITQIKQAEKMRRDFVANVSHELRTPLSAINGYAETLLEGALQDKSVAQDFIQIIYNHCQRLSHLVSDLLDLSKLESSESPTELNPVSLTPIIQKVSELSQKLLTEKQIALQHDLPAELPQVLAHAGNIEQVLTNLVDNAIKYTPAGGSITVKATANEKLVQVDVIDTGMGIEAKHIARVFERFYRVDKARSRELGGTGLGLAIVKHIIQYHGGEVWVNSTPGKGSTFSFTLQVADTSSS